MRPGWTWVAALACCACSGPKPAEIRQESVRLRTVMQTHMPAYRASVEEENRLIAATLEWLRGEALTAPRSAAASAARRWEERWSKVYFVPRYMHELRRGDEYRTAPAREAQKRILALLKTRYFELHDFQRYAQYAAESGMRYTPVGRLPGQLEEFRRRLEARAPARDDITPLLEGLPE